MFTEFRLEYIKRKIWQDESIRASRGRIKAKAFKAILHYRINITHQDYRNGNRLTNFPKLCNQQGHVIGMVTAKSQVGEGIDSYGVAVSAKSLIEFSQKHGTPLPLTVASDLESPPLDWPQVDELVQHAVVMVQKVRD